MTIIEETPFRFRIEQEGAMRVPGIVFATKLLLPDEHGDMALAQVANVATLPGIVRASYAMPDIHWGYGFPIGGVAATDIDKGIWRLPDRGVLEQVLTGGARFAVQQGHGVTADLQRCEDGGMLPGAEPATVSDRAVERGLGQIGSLGSGNHFLEIQAVDRIYDATAASRMGLAEGTVCVMIHTGSRGLGHQICTDHVRLMEKVMAGYGIAVPDRQLACVPARSPEGQAYLAAMAAAANYGRANRQLLTEATRRVFEAHTTTTLNLLYDVSHNLAKIETSHRRKTTHPVCASQGRNPAGEQRDGGPKTLAGEGAGRA